VFLVLFLAKALRSHVVCRLFINEAHLAEPKGKGPVVKIMQAYFVMVPDVPYQPGMLVFLLSHVWH